MNSKTLKNRSFKRRRTDSGSDSGSEEGTESGIGLNNVNLTSGEYQEESGLLVFPLVYLIILAQTVFSSYKFIKDKRTGCIYPHFNPKIRGDKPYPLEFTKYWLLKIRFANHHKYVYLHQLFWVWTHQILPLAFCQLMHVCSEFCVNHVILGSKYSFRIIVI